MISSDDEDDNMHQENIYNNSDLENQRKRPRSDVIERGTLEPNSNKSNIAKNKYEMNKTTMSMDNTKLLLLQQANPKSIPPDEYRSIFYNFLMEQHTGKYYDEIRDMLHSEKEDAHYSLQIDAQELLEYNPQIGFLLLKHPTFLLALLEEAILSAQLLLYNILKPSLENESDNYLEKERQQHSNRNEKHISVKGHVHARLYNLPPSSFLLKPSINSLRASDVGQYVQLSGTTVRASAVKLLHMSRAYRCKKCGYGFRRHVDLQQVRYKLNESLFVIIKMYILVYYF